MEPNNSVHLRITLEEMCREMKVQGRSRPIIAAVSSTLEAMMLLTVLVLLVSNFADLSQGTLLTCVVLICVTLSLAGTRRVFSAMANSRSVRDRYASRIITAYLGNLSRVLPFHWDDMTYNQKALLLERILMTYPELRDETLDVAAGRLMEKTTVRHLENV